MGLGPHFCFWGGLYPLLLNFEFFLNIESLSNTITIVFSIKASRFTKKMLQNFVDNISNILFENCQ